MTTGSMVSSSGQWDLGFWKLCNEMFNPLGVTGCVFAFLALLLSALIIGRSWTKPLVLAIPLAVITLLPFGCCLTSFLVDCLCRTELPSWRPHGPIEGLGFTRILDLCAPPLLQW